MVFEYCKYYAKGEEVVCSITLLPILAKKGIVFTKIKDIPNPNKRVHDLKAKKKAEKGE